MKLASHNIVDRIIFPCRLVTAILWAMSPAMAEDLSLCEKAHVGFDGVVPLRYAKVLGTNTSRLPIYDHFPAECGASEGTTCKSTAYILGGDNVAISKNCGKWAFMQFIGDKRVTTGWVDAARLSVSSREPDSGHLAMNPSPGIELKHYRFTLTMGRGHPVCEAYLQRLNQMTFSDPPYCDRPESNMVPGFAYLTRVWMAPEIYYRVKLSVDKLLKDVPRPGFYAQYEDARGQEAIGPPSVVANPASYPRVAWQYSTPVDIENRGTPANVAIWSDDYRSNAECVRYLFDSARPFRTKRSAIILLPDNSAIDVAATTAVFGRRDVRVLAPTGPDLKDPRRLTSGFRSIGSEESVFVYRNVSYFDTFFDNPDVGDFKGQRVHDEMLKNTLGVFLHKSGHTDQVCEYRANNQGD